MSKKTFFVSSASLMNYEDITQQFASALTKALIEELSDAPLLALANYEFYVNVKTEEPVAGKDGTVKLRVLLSSIRSVT